MTEIAFALYNRERKKGDGETEITKKRVRDRENY